MISGLKLLYNEVVLMLNDTRLHEAIDFQLPGYSLIRTDKDNATAGGTAIAVPSQWDVELVPSLSKIGIGYETTCVIILPPGCRPIKILSLYNHPQNYVSQTILTDFLDLKCNDKDIEGLIGGDLNCPHEAFSSRFSNTYGHHLLTTVNNLNLMVLENDEPTTFHRGEPNVLDLFLYHPRTHQLVQECYVGESVGSDHLPLIAHLQLNTTVQNLGAPKKRIIFDSKGYNEDLQQELLDFDPSCNSKSEVDEKLSLLMLKITEVKDKHTTERVWKHKRSNLPPEITSWISTRKALLKELKKARTEQEKREFSMLYNRANKIVKTLLEQFDLQEKEKTIKEMHFEKNTSKMWKKFHNLKGTIQPNNSIKRPLTNEQGGKVFSPEDKIKLFAERLEKIHQTPKHPTFDLQFEQEVNSFIENHKGYFEPLESSTTQENEDYHPILRPFTSEEIEQKAKMGKKGSAPGDDNISYDLLQKSPNILFVKLMIILNFCLQIGYFPKTWKDAKVIMVQKPGKDHTNPKNYRPISLLPTLGKIFESLICDRLVLFLEQNNLLNKYQAGYRKGRSTQEHIFRLSQQVYNGFKERKCTIAAFLDCEAAFDAVWTKGLMFKMYHLNIPHKLLRLLCSFLNDRSLVIHLDGKKSTCVQLKAGTPQGSCLSPILFNIHVNDIPFMHMTGCQPSQFADDTGIWSTGTNTTSTAAALQNALQQMEKWCKKWKVKLCPSKTNLVLFTKCSKAHAIKPAIYLFGEELTYKNEATFLGVKFNASLTWEPQIRTLVSKAQPRINLLKAMTTSSNNNIDLLLKLYKAIVRPIFEYSAIAHINAALCHQLKLQALQNSSIRTILKLPSYINTEILHDASGLVKLQDHTIEFAKKRLNSMSTTSPILGEVIEQFKTLSHIQTWKSPLECLL